MGRVELSQFVYKKEEFGNMEFIVPCNVMTSEYDLVEINCTIDNKSRNISYYDGKWSYIIDDHENGSWKNIPIEDIKPVRIEVRRIYGIS